MRIEAHLRSSPKRLRWSSLLLLQRPHSRSTPKENLAIELWQQGDIQSLLKECSTIQSRLESSIFMKMMLNGNGKAAMRYVVNQSKGGILKLSEETKQQLADKHPEGRDATDETLIEGSRSQRSPYEQLKHSS